MPAAPSDRRILVFSTVIVVAAGVLVAAILFVLTGGGGDTPKARPLFLGLERQLLASIRDEGPSYIASPFGGNGFWLDVDGDRVVAYALILPNTDTCTVKFKAQRDSYVDCNGDLVDRADLDQHEVTTRSSETRDRRVFVDVRVIIPAEGSDGGG